MPRSPRAFTNATAFTVPKRGIGLRLEFQGPFRAFTNDAGILPGCPLADCHGIYLWTVYVRSTYRITYIGETDRSFRQRITEHISNSFTGYERISSAQALLKGRVEVLWDGLWRADRRDRFHEFVRDVVRFAAAAKEELLVQHVFLAPVDADKATLRAIEGALAFRIRASPEAAALLPSDVRYAIRKTEGQPIEVAVTVPEPILGMPELIEV